MLHALKLVTRIQQTPSLGPPPHWKISGKAYYHHRQTVQGNRRTVFFTNGTVIQHCKCTVTLMVYEDALV